MKGAVTEGCEIARVAGGWSEERVNPGGFLRSLSPLLHPTMNSVDAGLDIPATVGYDLPPESRRHAETRTLMRREVEQKNNRE